MLFLRESLNEESCLEMITEGEDKKLYIKGVFAQAEKKNRNGRVYPKAVMEGAIDKYITEYVQKNRALGELSHPDNRPTVKPELACHRIVEMAFDGDNVVGKSLVLNTPQGQILRGLLEGGTQLGVSTRGLGTVTERAGTTYVGNDYLIMAVDAVVDPSGIDCWVDAVNESKEWLVTDDGQIIESIQKNIKKNKLTEEKKLELFSQFMRMIR